MCCFEQQISNGSFIFEKKSAHLRKFREGQQWTACRRPPRLCVNPWGGIEEQKEGQHKNTPCPRRGAGPSIYRQGPGVCLDVLRPHLWPPSSFPAQAHLLTWHLNWGGCRTMQSPGSSPLCLPSLPKRPCLSTDSDQATYLITSLPESRGHILQLSALGKSKLRMFFLKYSSPVVIIFSVNGCPLLAFTWPKTLDAASMYLLAM